MISMLISDAVHSFVLRLKSWLLSDVEVTMSPRLSSMSSFNGERQIYQLDPPIRVSD